MAGFGLLVADLQELKANPKRDAIGTIVEAQLDKGRGPVATAIVQTGTLKVGIQPVVNRRAEPCRNAARRHFDHRAPGLILRAEAGAVQLVAVGVQNQALDLDIRALTDLGGIDFGADGSDMLLHPLDHAR